MYVARLSTRPLSNPSKAQLSKAAAFFAQSYALPSTKCTAHVPSRRPFTSGAKIQVKGRDLFPEPEHGQIKRTEPAWPHPPYSVEQMRSKVYFAHRKPRDFSDRVALGMVRFLRWCTDFATGYKHNVEAPKTASDSNAVTATKPYQMSERKWLIRYVFLESVAGVPGMVADNGWIETLLEEAYNERMHLLTFLKMYEPGLFMRTMILGAQGVFFNSFFLCYLFSPKTCHRFVGYLEEEAVLTYTLSIQDLENGHLPKWADPNFKAPDLAIEYWGMPEGHRSMRDLLYYIRADEAKHREVNHTLGNLKQDEDPNPFVSVYGKEVADKPGKGIESLRPLGPTGEIDWMIPLCSLHDFGVGEEGKSIFGVLILGARGTKMGSTGRIFCCCFWFNVWISLSYLWSRD
ncbi:hypothetical protein EYC84_002602 [Monilinia fructicola]|uniref:Alternative oxidase n=1 Tax=Monilinia fructicola TaxID=38448 RepID=A0A5M9JTW6_MONFR|nr:hypothetical protein EYC84_002602 [Monilinia fructicola]